MPSAEEVARELGKAKSIDDFYGKDGIFSRLFSKTIEEMLEAELTTELGYKRYEAEGRNSGNSRNGYYTRKMRTSGGDAEIKVPRDRNGEFQSALLQKNSNEIEQKITAMYAKGMSTRDIQELLTDLYGIDVSPETISAITDKVWPLVEGWQNRPLAPVYAMLYLDAIHIKLKRDGRIDNVAVYNVLGIDLDGHREILGHWVGDGGEGANFWLSVVTDLQNRGVQDVFIAAIDGLTGFKEAIQAVFPQTKVQRCIIHQMKQAIGGMCLLFKLESSELFDSQALVRLCLITATATLYLVSSGLAVVSRGLGYNADLQVTFAPASTGELKRCLRSRRSAKVDSFWPPEGLLCTEEGFSPPKRARRAKLIPIHQNPARKEILCASDTRMAFGHFCQRPLRPGHHLEGAEI
jgi:hypothetical protein